LTGIDCAFFTIPTTRDGDPQSTSEHVRHLNNGFPENVILANRDLGHPYFDVCLVFQVFRRRFVCFVPTQNIAGLIT
jgi:hypothetical protein